MKKFYPNKELSILGIVFLLPSIFLIVWTFAKIEEIEPERLWIFISVLLFLCVGEFYCIIDGSLSIRFGEGYIGYKRTCFSPQKKLLLQDIYRAVFSYRYKEIILVAGEKKYRCQMDIRVVKELLSLLPKEVFCVKTSSWRGMWNKHRELLLNADILDEVGLKNISENLWYWDRVKVDLEQSCFTYKNTSWLPPKKILFQDIYKVIFDYRRKPSVFILATGGRSYYVDVELETVQTLLSILPKEIFSVEYHKKDSVTKAHRKLFLEADILTEAQRKEMMDKAKRVG
jgi:hypothetical protein